MVSEEPSMGGRDEFEQPLFRASPSLLDILEDARRRKFLGVNVSTEAHVANGAAFAGLIADEDTGRLDKAADLDVHIVDLGSGGGVPALVIADALPRSRMTLIERGTNRASFLEGAVLALGWSDRIDVVCDDAEAAARRAELSGSADVVTARSFGPPSVTLESATRFLRIGGRLIVSEPPPDGSSPSRWPDSDVALLGCTVGRAAIVGRHNFQILHRTGSIDDETPRRAAVTRKRPRF